MIKQFFSTNTQSWSLLVSRLALGAVILPHGMKHTNNINANRLPVFFIKIKLNSTSN